MGVFFDNKDRKIIPRWRTSKQTLFNGELHPLKLANKNIEEGEDFFIAKVVDWEKNKSLLFATDLISSALVLNRYEEAKEAAKFILSANSGASSSAKDLATKLLNPEKTVLSKAVENFEIEPQQQINIKIHNMRLRLRDEPRNSILWVDLAREYTSIGLLEKAKHIINIATVLSPSNRFVLRSAARLYIHCNEIDQAHNLLIKSETIKQDPWLIAAEIAISSILDRNSRLVKFANGILKNDSVLPSQITELASAVASLELVSGNIRESRKLFRQALKHPTENTIAQAQWASRYINGLEFRVHYAQIANSFEAKAFTSYFEGNFQETVRQCWNWLYDQPFSSRPASLGSYVATIGLEDYEEGRRIIQASLQANPYEPLLLNNLAVILVNLNEIEEAEKVFSKINSTNLKPIAEVTFLATKGLIRYRQGLSEEGRYFYTKAIEKVEELKKSSKSNEDLYSNIKALASLFFAQEEILTSSSKNNVVIEQLLESNKNLLDPCIVMLQERVRTLYRNKQLKNV